jgi:hypothetical protein
LPQPFGESYRYFEWAGMFERTFGDQTRIGFDMQVHRTQDVLQSDRPYLIARYRLKDFDPAGCQAAMRIAWGNVAAWGLESPPDPWRLVLRYQSLRLFSGRERLERFLDEVTKITLRQLDVPQASSCVHRS